MERVIARKEREPSPSVSSRPWRKDVMSSFSGKKNNAVHPTSDNLLAVPNGHSDGGKRKITPKRSKNVASKLWTEEIQALKSCEEFFLKQTNLKTDAGYSPSYYDIRNSKGKLVFKAIESVDPGIRDLYHDKGSPPFVITIFDMKAGKEMLRVNANLRQGVMLVYVKQSTEDKIIGIVRRVHARCPICTSSFSLERPNGAVLLRIQSSFSPSNLICCSCTCRLCPQFVKNRGKNFRILMTDEVTHVGDIKYSQKHFEEKDDEEANRREEMVTASFPGDTTATNKALVLASLFLLDSLYFQDQRRVRKIPKISRTCYIVLVIVLLVVLIGVLAAVFGGKGYQGNKSVGGRGRPGIG